jgi:hypothetical protein
MPAWNKVTLYADEEPATKKSKQLIIRRIKHAIINGRVAAQWSCMPL